MTGEHDHRNLLIKLHNVLANQIRQPLPQRLTRCYDWEKPGDQDVSLFHWLTVVATGSINLLMYRLRPFLDR